MVVEVVVDVLVEVVVLVVASAVLDVEVDVLVVVVPKHVSQSVPVQFGGQMQTKPLPERAQTPPLRQGFGSHQFVEQTMPQALSKPIMTVGGAQLAATG